MEKDDARMDDLITSSRWEDLSEEEKMFVINQVGSREGFNRLRNTSRRLSDDSIRAALAPEPNVLVALLAKLKTTEKPILNQILEFRVPAYLVALLVTGSVVLTLSLTGSEKRLDERQPPMSHTVIKKDTIYQTNTVVQEKLVYRYVSTTTSGLPLPRSIPYEKSVDSIGVSMQERGALDQLLVSMP